MKTCELCKKKKFFVKPRVFKIPRTGGEMTSKPYCRKCYKGMREFLKVI